MQDLENLKVEEITPLTPEIISRQATQNIGTIGHVAHGKSTLVLAISGTNVSEYLPILTQNVYRPSNIERKECVTSPLSSGMPTLSYTSAQLVQPQTAINLINPTRKIKQSAHSAKPNSFCIDTCPSSIAQVMMSWWLPCSQEQLSWTQLYFLSLETIRCQCPKPENI